MTKNQNTKTTARGGGLALKYILTCAALCIVGPSMGGALNPNLGGRILSFFVILAYGALLSYLVYVSYSHPKGVKNGKVLYVAVVSLAILLLIIVDEILSAVELPGHCGIEFSTGNCLMAEGLGELIYYPIGLFCVVASFISLLMNIRGKYRRLRKSPIKSKMEPTTISRSSIRKRVVVLITITILFTAIAVIMVANGTKPPVVTDVALRRKSDDIKKQFTSNIQQIASDTGLTFLTKGIHDACYKEWDYAKYHCAIRLTSFYGMNGDFKEGMTSLDHSLISREWGFSYLDGIPTLLSDYYQSYVSKDPSFNEVSSLPDVAYSNLDKRYIDIKEYEVPVKNVPDVFEYDQEIDGVSAYIIYEKKDIKSDSEVSSIAIEGKFDYVIRFQTEKEYYLSN